MKKFSLVALFVMIACIAFSQSGKKHRTLPTIELKNLKGEVVNIANIDNDGKPIIISFWATWCKNCIKELDAIEEYYEDWQEETGVKLIAVSIDNSRSSSKVLPFVNGRGWEYDVLLDVNSELKRSLSVNLIPHTFIINGKGEIVWQHTAYSAGDEDEYYEVVKKIIAGEDVSH